jgi:hypothetical protein
MEGFQISNFRLACAIHHCDMPTRFMGKEREMTFCGVASRYFDF